MLARILRREAGDSAAAMIEGYFRLGDETELQLLCKAAGIASANILSREGWARFVPARLASCQYAGRSASPIAVGLIVVEFTLRPILNRAHWKVTRTAAGCASPS